MKNKLVVMYSQNRINPENTWSGTSLSLTKALTNYNDVYFVDLKKGFFLKILKRLVDFIGKYRASKVWGLIYDKCISFKASFLLLKYKGIPVLEIADEVELNRDYYLYQDLSLRYVADMRKKSGITVNGGGLKNHICTAELNRRVDVQKKIYCSVTKSFFMGHWMTEYMKTIYPELSRKFIYAGGGINPEFDLHKDNKEREKNTILFIGIDFERKGGYLVLEAFKILKNTIPNLRLVIIGCPEKEKIEGVTWLGKQSRDVISNYFLTSSVFCMPSYFEAYGLVFLESLLFGLPIVTRDEFEMRYFIKEGINGELIQNSDPVELAGKLLKVLSSESYVQNVKNEFDFYREIYSWEHVANVISQEIFANSSEF